MTDKVKAAPKKTKTAVKREKYRFPPLLAQVVEKAGSLDKAGKMMGYTGSYVIAQVGLGERPFTDDLVKRAEDALAGKEIITKAKSGEIRTAILVAKAAEFEQLYDIGKMMGGEWKWKRKAGSDWVGVIQMASGNLNAYLAMATAKGVESFTT